MSSTVVMLDVTTIPEGAILVLNHPQVLSPSAREGIKEELTKLGLKALLLEEGMQLQAVLVPTLSLPES